MGEATLNLWERDFLRRLAADGAWTYLPIRRDGRNRNEIPVRQACRRKGLAEHSTATRRAWRITKAGLQALTIAAESLPAPKADVSGGGV